VTLTPWILRVKQARTEFLLLLAVSLLVAMSMLALHDHDDIREADARLFGTSLAEGLAGLVVEPLDGRDRIRLGVLANRLVELPPVAGVTIYTVADEMLAISGETRRGLALIKPVTQDDNIIGYVRITLIRPGSAAARTEFWLALALAFVIPLGVIALRTVSWPQRKPDQPVAPIPEETEKQAAQPVSCGLLAVNLFNQLTLKPEQRGMELEHATSVASSVADLYAGNVESLSGTGLLLSFDGSEDAERSFQFICAAMLLARLLNAPDSPGQYRLGMHMVTLPANHAAPTDLLEIRDAALLSALARPDTLAISAALYDQVPRPERLLAEPMHNPLLNQLESTEPAAWLVYGLSENHSTLIEAQARELGYSSEPATPSESTF